ncbi:hypothetical protein [Rhodococcus koreensis]|uniref:hypothetical protein n=1 Tax=Rhodococcus koreensis TaxID=99653 RepID=UPI00366E8E8E
MVGKIWAGAPLIRFVQDEIGEPSYFTCLIGAIAVAAWPHRTPGYQDCAPRRAAADFAGSRVTVTRALVAAIATARVLTRVSETSEAEVPTKASAASTQRARAAAA